jgi:hypothetical protein
MTMKDLLADGFDVASEHHEGVVAGDGQVDERASDDIVVEREP